MSKIKERNGPRGDVRLGGGSFFVFFDPKDISYPHPVSAASLVLPVSCSVGVGRMRRRVSDSGGMRVLDLSRGFNHSRD